MKFHARCFVSHLNLTEDSLQYLSILDHSPQDLLISYSILPLYSNCYSSQFYSSHFIPNLHCVTQNYASCVKPEAVQVTRQQCHLIILLVSLDAFLDCNIFRYITNTNNLYISFIP